MPPSTKFRLLAGEVHVWCADLTRITEIDARLLGVLDEEEKGRASRFYEARHRIEYAAAHAIARVLIGTYLARPGGSIGFVRAANGKPRLILDHGEPALRFNASRTAGAALFAFALKREVGVDIEKIRPRSHFQELCARALSPAERASMDRISNEQERVRAFHRLWARKEAVLKASGDGLKIGPALFDVTEPNVQLPGKPSAEWRVADVACDPTYAAAVAAEGADWRLADVHDCEEMLLSYCA
jgi:4'-phosphopantetheinyl transferase